MITSPVTAGRPAQLGPRPQHRERTREEAVLGRYLAMIPNDDVVLDVPVGTDRTLAALLIARQTLGSGRTALFLTDDVDLALARAGSLSGLSAVKYHGGGQNSLSELVAYHNAQTLGITDYPTYFSTSSKIEPPEVAIFHCIEMAAEFVGSLFTLRIDRRLQRRIYDRICGLFLRLRPSAGAVARMLRDDAGAAVLPARIDDGLWESVADETAQVLTAELHTEEARFTWPRLQPLLHKCQVLVGPGAIEIRPPRELMRSLPGYRYATRRVHLRTPLADRAEEAAPHTVPARPPQSPPSGVRERPELRELPELPELPERAALPALPELPDLDRMRPSASIRSAVTYLRENYADSDVTLGRVARTVYMSQYHFSRSFKEQTGWRFIDFVTALRQNEAQRLLRETAMSVTDISRQVGYRELSHFQRTFKKRCGMSASAYRACFQERAAGTPAVQDPGDPGGPSRS